MKRAAPRAAGRRFLIPCAIAVIVSSIWPFRDASADDRKFFVAPALSSKSGDSGAPDYPRNPGSPPAPLSLIRKAYLDKTDPNMLSFAEYWAEISYGDITVSGDAFDFVNVPWRATATTDALEDQEADPTDRNRLLWTDLDQNPTVRSFSYGIGEVVNEFQQRYHTFRLTLDPDTGRLIPEAVTGLRDGVFSPGERFRDVNGSGNYTYVEFIDSNMNFAFDDDTEGMSAFDADENGRIDCPVCGQDVGGTFAEPFEDFMRTFDSTAGEGERWVKTSDEYIARNYPGNVGALQVDRGFGTRGRTENGAYDGPDDWTERNVDGNPTLKLQDNGFSEPDHSTGQPSWFVQFWTERYNVPASAVPAWRSDIPTLDYFNPEEPDPSTIPNDNQIREFRPSQGCIGGSGCDPDEIYPPSDSAPDDVGTVLPDGADPKEYYDGPVEFDDLASSIYHELPDGAAAGARWTNGDLRLGEVTSPANFDNYGETANGSGGPIPSGGPLASGVSGTNGAPAGNMLNIELLTWQHEPSPDPNNPVMGNQPIASKDPGLAIWNSPAKVVPGGPTSYRQMYAGGFRDFNLDGLIDQGETIPLDTEQVQYSNYAFSFTLNDFLRGEYPFNRDRLTEDVVAALDPNVNWSQFTQQSGTYARIIYGTVLLAPQAEQPYDGVGREFSPSLIPIRTNDNLPGNYFRFTNLIGSLANVNADDSLADPPIKPDFDVTVVAHEFGHFWEGWPDLYDETANDPGDVTINQPFGRFDLMSLNAPVHPAPFLKQNVNIATGQFNPGAHRQHTPWINPIDLRHVLTPNQPQTIIIPPCEPETSRATGYYYFDNIAQPDRRERFYFWVVSNNGFDIFMPGRGMLISHIDLGAGGGIFPPQNTDGLGSFFRYALLQADGLQELDSNIEVDGIGPVGVAPDDVVVGGPNVGDAGDTYPGAVNKHVWNETTSPDNFWHDQLDSGLEIQAIETLPNQGRAVTFLWDPKEVPSLTFIRPPGGASLPLGDCEIYRVTYSAFDFFGGTQIEFYRDDDNEGYDGVPLAFDLVSDVPVPCSATDATMPTPVPKQPGTIQSNVPVHVGDLPNGEYFFYARMVPGPNSQNMTDPSASDVYPASTNEGDGTLDITNVNLDESKVELWTVFLNASETAWSVEGSVSGVQTGTATTGNSYTTDGGEVSFTITAGTKAFEAGDRFAFLTTGLTPYSAGLKVQDGVVLSVPKAIFAASPATGAKPLNVTFTSTSLDPNDAPLTHTWNFGDGQSTSGSELRVTQHTYQDPGRYTATLTVTNPLNQTDQASKTIVVIDNELPQPTFTVSATSGVAPVSIDFDATGTTDPEDGTNVTLKWNFGDNSNEVTGPYATTKQVSHTYQQLGDYVPSLTATDQGGASKTVQGPTISLTGNSSPQASFIANPKTGGAPLKVDFDASNSVDPDGDPLTYSWKFGDGGTGNGVQTSHTYQAIGTYIAELTVSDGQATGTKTETIDVKNQPPAIALTATPTTGTPPLEVTFDASASVDPEGGPLTFNWTFGDGTSIANGSTIEKHTYTTVGSFTARLTVTDDQGESSLAVRTISVSVPGNRPPNVSVGADPQSGPAGVNVSFNMSGTTDPDGDPVQLTLDFGDGGVLVNLLPTSKVSHTYTAAGMYTVIAVGSDGKGASGQAQIQIEVTGAAGGGTGQPGTSPNPCAAGIAQAVVFGLVGLTLMSVGTRRRRRLC